MFFFILLPLISSEFYYHLLCSPDYFKTKDDCLDSKESCALAGYAIKWVDSDGCQCLDFCDYDKCVYDSSCIRNGLNCKSVFENPNIFNCFHY